LTIDKRAEIRAKALEDLQHSGVLMLNGHFDYGNGYHGRAYLNPHQLFRHPSTIWRFAQDLLDVVPTDLLTNVELVAGPATGGALLAHTIAGLLDSRRSLSHPACLFAPIHHNSANGFAIREFYRREMNGKRVLLADDVRNTGDTFERCATLIKAAGGVLLATVEIYDRIESVSEPAEPNIALAEYHAPENYKAKDCPLCKAGEPITRF
jgi:orotate phosphoribosyltransferase